MDYSRLINLLVRRKQPVIFTDQHKTMPISNVFGYDRGMPVDRYYIEHFLKQNAQLISGRVLEIGDNIYTLNYGGADVTESIILTADKQLQGALVGDLTDFQTLPHEYFDCFICTQTLNFIYDIKRAILGSRQLLKSGGFFLGTVAGISQISQYDMDRWGDYWRFTKMSLENLFRDYFNGNVEIASYGNCLAACSLLQGISVEDLPDRSLLDNHDQNYQVILTIKAKKDR